MDKVDCGFYFNESKVTRKKLFEEALLNAKNGKVLYILSEELEELPQLSQNIAALNKHYMNMISFMYVNSLDALIESIATLPDWKNVPSTIILDDLGVYCNKNNLQNACGVVALLLNTASCCSTALVDSQCVLRIAMCPSVVGEEYCSMLKELYLPTQ